MSTEINIKKRIDIQEEGVSITPDVNSINFTGDGVSASAIGDDVTVNITGGMGTTTYYLNESVTQAPYKEFTSALTASPEQTIVTSIASGATVTIQSFQTPSGVPGTTNIPGGRWAFYLHFSGTTGDSWDVFAEVYKRDLGGIETLLLTTDAVPTSTLTGTAVMLLSDGVFPASTVLTTDRIVVKVKVTNTDSTTNSITFHTEGNTNYSIGTTTLNQVIPTGSVTSVTGTAPVVSSGGTTPAISMPAANGTTNGYLTSADWTAFNSKVSSNIYTADGTVTGDRTVNLNNNDLTFTDGGAATARFQVNIDDGTNAVVIDAANSFGVSLTASSSGGSGSVNVSTSGVNINGLYNLPQISGSTGQVLTRTSGSNTTWASAAGGLTYFTEAQNTAAPNATVNVDSLTAVASTANADFVIKPKGTGALITDIPDGTGTGGAKRGQYAVDLQLTRAIFSRIASGNYSVALGRENTASATDAITIGNNGNATGPQSIVIGTGTASGTTSGVFGFGTATNLQAFSVGYQSNASGQESMALGHYNTCNNSYSYALGRENTSSGVVSVAIGQSNIANTSRATAIGHTNTASGSYSVAIGQSNTASGTNATVIGNSSTANNTYAMALSNNAIASGIYSFAFGGRARSSGYGAVAFGGYPYVDTTASADNAIAIGAGNTASAQFGTAVGGYGNVASGVASYASGSQANTFGIYGRQSRGYVNTVSGDCQKSEWYLSKRTTDATVTTLVIGGGTFLPQAQILLQNNNAFRFKGTIIGKQSGSTNTSAWDVDGLIVRGTTAASTSVVVGNVNLVSNIPGWGTPTVTADTTNGCLTVQVTGLGATNIQWTASIETTEVIYA